MYIPLKPLFSRYNGIGVQFTDEPIGGIYHCKAHVSADGSAAEIQGGVDGLSGG